MLTALMALTSARWSFVEVKLKDGATEGEVGGEESVPVAPGEGGASRADANELGTGETETETEASFASDHVWSEAGYDSRMTHASG